MRTLAALLLLCATAKADDAAIFASLSRYADAQSTGAARKAAGTDAPVVIPKVAPPVVKQSLTTPRDGQLWPNGKFRYSSKQRTWVPVKQPGPMWHEGGHSATVNHLVSEHGYSRAMVERWTPAQRDIAHSNAHNATRKVVAPQKSLCPDGRCPNTTTTYYRSGWFRRY